MRKELDKSDKKLVKSLFWYSFLLEPSYNYERQQGLGFAVSMIPAIKKFYKTKEEQKDALVRHMAIFNTTPHISSVISGVVASLEKEASENKDFDKSIINNVKISLMGPLAGIGDSFFWGTLRVICAGIGISLASKGSVLGAILFLVLFNTVHILFRYFGVYYGYKFGVNILSNLSENNILNNISRAGNIVGLTVIGAMTAQMVNLKTNLSFTIEQSEYLIQDYIDQIFPALLPLLYTIWMYMLLKKGYKSQTILFITIAISIVLAFLKIV